MLILTVVMVPLEVQVAVWSSLMQGREVPLRLLMRSILVVDKTCRASKRTHSIHLLVWV